MHLIIRFSDDKRIEGVMLAVGRRRMRVVARGLADALDLLCDADGKWRTEHGDLFTWDSMLGLSEADSASLSEYVFPKVLAAH